MACVEVVVNSLAGHSCNVFAEDSWTVNRLKAAVQEHMAVPVAEQKLFFGTTCLDDDDLMSILRDGAEEEILRITMIRLSTEMVAWIQKLRASCHYHVFRSAPEHIQNCRDVVFAAVCGDANVLSYASEEFQKDRGIVVAAVKQNASIFQGLPEEIRADREITLLAVFGDGRNLEYAAKELHADLELVDVAVRTYARALLLCPQVFWNADLVLTAVNTSKRGSPSLHTSFLQHTQLKVVFGQKDFMQAAIENDPMSLQFAANNLKADRELVTRAVDINWRALEHAAYELRSDRELMRMALAQNPCALQFAGKELCNDFDLVLAAVKVDPNALTYASRKLQQDDVVSAVAWAKYNSLQAQR